MKVTLYQEAFIYTLVHSSCLFLNGPLGMVYELLQDYFGPNDFANAFDLFRKVCGHIVLGHIPPLILHLLYAFRLLTLEK